MLFLEGQHKSARSKQQSWDLPKCWPTTERQRKHIPKAFPPTTTTPLSQSQRSKHDVRENQKQHAACRRTRSKIYSISFLISHTWLCTQPTENACETMFIIRTFWCFDLSILKCFLNNQACLICKCQISVWIICIQAIKQQMVNWTAPNKTTEASPKHKYWRLYLDFESKLLFQIHFNKDIWII